jgi:hypothetical protein
MKTKQFLVSIFLFISLPAQAVVFDSGGSSEIPPQCWTVLYSTRASLNDLNQAGILKPLFDLIDTGVEEYISAPSGFIRPKFPLPAVSYWVIKIRDANDWGKKFNSQLKQAIFTTQLAHLHVLEPFCGGGGAD